MKRLFCLMTFVLSCEAALADCNSTFCTTTIDRIHNTNLPDGVVHIQIADSIAPLSCTAEQGVFLSLKTSHPLFDEIYSTLLAATIANSYVRVSTEANSSDCKVNYVQLFSRWPLN